MKHRILPDGRAAAGAPTWRKGVLGLTVCVLLISPQVSDARARHPVSKLGSEEHQVVKPATPTPIYETRLHYVGQTWLAITTWGLFGTEGSNRVHPKDRELLGIAYSPSFEFPAGTRNDYIYGSSLWIGGIVGTDTLVSIAMNGESASRDEWNSSDTVYERSSLLRSQFYNQPDDTLPSGERIVAKAEQEFVVNLYDTLVLNSTDGLDGRRHRPLNLEIRQTSYAWSDVFARQSVIVDYWIKNIGESPINKMAFGIYMDADVLNDEQNVPNPWQDDVSGFLESGPNLAAPDVLGPEPLNVAWVADNDGDPIAGTFPTFSPRGAIGIRILRSPPVKDFSFNWWLISSQSSQEWGPAKAGSRPTTGSGGLGAPEGDRNKYYVMTNTEVDYGQLVANVDHTKEGWRPVLRAGGCDIANGLDTRQVISVGPTHDPLLPGDSLPFTIALCGGDAFHTNPAVNYTCDQPDAYVNSLDFANLGFAATWASWVFDIPGVDTDGDGYRGEFRLAPGSGDTVWYCGDCGPPPGPGGTDLSLHKPRDDCADFSKPSAPPCPPLFIQTRPETTVVLWDGEFTEREEDYEGYRLWVSTIDNSEQSYNLLAQWDVVDYFVFAYDTVSNNFVQLGDPYTEEELIQAVDLFIDLPGDFVPENHFTPTTEDTLCLHVVRPWSYVDSISGETIFIVDTTCAYLAPAFGNRNNEYTTIEQGLTSNVIQRYDSAAYEFGGQLYYYGKYRAIITDLNPAVKMWISVSAFDHGNAKQKIGSLESGIGPTGCWEVAIPIYSADVVEAKGLNVSVFPNPYKISFEGPKGKRTTYFDEGFEAPKTKAAGGSLDEQDRRIYFINLPSDATIRIYTLDGDLVREITHYDPAFERSEDAPTSDYSSRAYWDLITRNTQAAVSGIYIWRVDSKATGRSQIGKLVVIK